MSNICRVLRGRILGIRIFYLVKGFRCDVSKFLKYEFRG